MAQMPFSLLDAPLPEWLQKNEKVFAFSFSMDGGINGLIGV